MQHSTNDERQSLTAGEDDPGDIIGGSGACGPVPSRDTGAPAAIAIAVDGACCPPPVGEGKEGDGCAVVTNAADISLLLLLPPPPPIPTVFDDPLVSTGIIAVSGNKLSPGPPGGPMPMPMGGRAAVSGDGVLSPELFMPGSLGNGACCCCCHSCCWY